MKTYMGVRDEAQERYRGDVKVYVVEGDRAHELRHVSLHSPGGVEWGYPGSGPADLALSLLADCFGETPEREQLRSMEADRFLCVRLHQRFKFDFVARFAHEGWRLEEAEIHEWAKSYIERIRREEEEAW